VKGLLTKGSRSKGSSVPLPGSGILVAVAVHEAVDLELRAVFRVQAGLLNLADAPSVLDQALNPALEGLVDDRENSALHLDEVHLEVYSNQVADL
jgi:hypothetical protein